MRKIMVLSLVIFMTSCSIFSTEEKIKNNTGEKIEIKTLYKENEDNNKILKNKNIIEKKETIDILKYQLSLEEDFLKNKDYLNIPKIEIKNLSINNEKIFVKEIDTKKNNQNLGKNNEIEKKQMDKAIYGQDEKTKLLKKDYFSDNSLFKYIDNKIHYKKLSYIPENLVSLKGKYIYDAKINSKVRKITLEKLKLLSEQFYKNFGIKLKIVSAYRSYNYQKGIKDRGCPDLFCAKAGYSEHQSGLAVDFWAATDVNNYKKNPKLKKYFEWMKINGPKYGFTNTYQKGRKTDGYAIEPWHWRYVGKELATYLYKNNLTFADFFYSNIQK